MAFWAKNRSIEQECSRIVIFRSLMLFVVISVLCAGAVRAEIASPAEMEQVCENWLTQMTFEKGTWAESVEPKISAVHEIAEEGVILARYYSISPRGFVLVPVLKEMTPVKAYSDESNLDESQAGGFLALISEVLTSRYEIYKQTYGSLNAPQTVGEEVFDVSYQQQWDTYTRPADEFVKTLAEKAPMLDAGPLLTSSWHQGDPYNSDCPSDAGGLSVVGCTATAMSQVLKFWQWPAAGFGSHTYTWYNNYCGNTVPPSELSADFSDAYDWANIVDSCDAGCTPDQEAALAELCHEVGVAIDMDYGSCGSAASLNPYAYIVYFRYSQDIHWERRIDHTLESWFQVIKDEIDAGRPMQYGINRHSIVCDGYQEFGPGVYTYHMNYGWGNSFNAWYMLDNLSCSWVSGGTCPWEEDYLLAGIHPQTEPFLYLTGATMSESGDGNGHANAGESMDISVTIENMGVDAENAVANLATGDSYITVTASTTAFDAIIPTGGSSTGATPFTVEIAGNCPDPHVAVFEMTTTDDNGAMDLDSIYLFIGDTPGFADDMESGPGVWRHTALTMTYDDQWHMETYRSNSATTSWKAGGPGSDDYGNSQDACLMTPPFLLPDNAEMTFWHWMEAETDIDPAQAWDGSVVMISIDNGEWEQVFPEGGYPCTLIGNLANALPGGTPCYGGSFDWTEATFDLSAYSGVAQIMFRFAIDGAVNEEGWYVDDIAVIDAGPAYLCGDANSDLSVDVGDAVYIINYVFKGGPEPDPLLAGDANCDLSCDVGDAVYLINYAFKGGPSPCAGCPQ